MKNRKFKIAKKKIEKANKILLTIHEKPDGDAVSSICAVIDYLEEIGVPYYAYSLSEIPETFFFLNHSDKIKNSKDYNFKEFDVVIALDCGSLARTNLGEEITNREKRQTVIEFDHHPKVDDFSDIELRDVDAASTTEVLYDFFTTNNIKINKTRAVCILTGISTDTGNFIYPSTSEKTINISSEMLVRGASLPNIIESTWRNKTLSGMKIWGRAIESLVINKKFNIAISVLTKKDIDECGVKDEELEGISGFLSNMEGARGLLMLTESGDGYVKGSLRSSSDSLDVSKLARTLGGGGHVKAAGFKIKGRLVRDSEKWRIV